MRTDTISIVTLPTAQNLKGVMSHSVGETSRSVTFIGRPMHLIQRLINLTHFSLQKELVDTLTLGSNYAIGKPPKEELSA